MANPPPARPWMRLASIARPALPTVPVPAAPPPPPASVPAPVQPPESSPVPRSPLVRPTFRPSAPTSPAMSPVISPPPPPVAPPVVVASTVPSALPPSVISPTPPPVAPAVVVAPTVPAALPPSVISPTQNVEAPSIAALPVISTLPGPPSPNLRGSVPSSPIIKSSKPTTTEIANPSPKLIRTFAQSPPQPSPYKPQLSPYKPQPLAPPPSPLTLPPSQLKYEAEPESKIPAEVQQKTVLMQNEKGGSRPHENITGSAMPGSPHKSDVETKEKNTAQIKKVLDSNDKGTRVITIAGENRGSFMEIIHKDGKADNYFQRNGRRVGKNNEDTGREYYSSDQNEEGNLNPRDKNQKTKGTTHSLPGKAFMNSNVQGVNNSILFNSSCSHHNPGVHLSLSRKPSDNELRSKHHSGDRHS